MYNYYTILEYYNHYEILFNQKRKISRYCLINNLSNMTKKL